LTKHLPLAVVFILFHSSVVLSAQNLPSPIEPHLKAALTSFRLQCGSVPIDAKPDRRFAHWISSPQESGWLEYAASAEPWQKWDGSFEGADVFKTSSGLLVQMWTGSDTNDWSRSTEYCANAQGKIQSALTSFSSDGSITIAEQQADPNGKFQVTQSACFVVDKTSTVDCATSEQSVLEGMKLYSSLRQFPLAIAEGPK
jgi:hypothetical protein